jgi:hypothetical protein
MTYNLTALDNTVSLPGAINGMNTMLGGLLVYFVLLFVFIATIVAMRNKPGDDAVLISGAITAFLAILSDVALGGTLNSAAVMLPLIFVIGAIIYKAFNKRF